MTATVRGGRSTPVQGERPASSSFNRSADDAMLQHPIPRRIIQTAKHRALTVKQQAMVANLKLLHPDYEYCFFDNADVDRFVDQEFARYSTTFARFPIAIQKYDFFRYLAVYRLGGFYFDLDVLLAKPLEPLLETGCVFPFEGLTFSRLLRDRGMDWEIGNYAFGATAGHPFLAAVIDNCVRAEADPAWASAMLRGVPFLSRPDYVVLTTTGPGQLSRTLAENPRLSPLVTVLFPDDVCDPRTWNVFGDFGVHLMEGTWRARAGFFRRRLANTWESWQMKRLLAESRRLGSHRRTVPADDAAAR